MLLTKVQRHVHIKQHIIDHAVVMWPIVHCLHNLLPHVIGSDHSHPILFLCDLSSSYCCLYNTRSLTSQPFTDTTSSSKIRNLCIRVIMAKNKKSLVWEYFEAGTMSATCKLRVSSSSIAMNSNHDDLS